MSYPDFQDWVFNHENKGKKVSIYDCFYCGLHSKHVECGGIYHCPNPKCTGPGGAWFRVRLVSFRESGQTHTVDQDEWDRAANQYLVKLGLRDKEIYGAF